MNNPYYAEGRKHEPIDVINDWQLDFNLGNAVKYISRCRRKGNVLNALDDLQKASDYINYEMTLLREEIKEDGYNVED